MTPLKTVNCLEKNVLQLIHSKWTIAGLASALSAAPAASCGPGALAPGGGVFLLCDQLQ